MNNIRQTFLFFILAIFWGNLPTFAQTLVLHHQDGSTTEVEETLDFYMVNVGDNIMIIADGNVQQFLREDIAFFSFKQLKGDVNRDGCVGIGDIVAITNIMASSPEAELEPVVTETFTVNGVAFTMVKVEGGSFLMGATSEQGNEYDSDERPVHQVTLSDYYIGSTEVTQELWRAVMGSDPSYFPRSYTTAKLPVESFNWDECHTFITKLNEMTGLQFRLPTEAEWEFAARGGKRSKNYKYSGSNNPNDVAWYEENAKESTHDVNSMTPNELGILNMSGNVWECCSDEYGEYVNEAQTNPTGPKYGSSHFVIRGGCWGKSSRSCRVSERGTLSPSTKSYTVGLRLAL